MDAPWLGPDSSADSYASDDDDTEGDDQFRNVHDDQDIQTTSGKARDADRQKFWRTRPARAPQSNTTHESTQKIMNRDRVHQDKTRITDPDEDKPLRKLRGQAQYRRPHHERMPSSEVFRSMRTGLHATMAENIFDESPDYLGPPPSWDVFAGEQYESEQSLFYPDQNMNTAHQKQASDSTSLSDRAAGKRPATINESSEESSDDEPLALRLYNTDRPHLESPRGSRMYEFPVYPKTAERKRPNKSLNKSGTPHERSRGRPRRHRAEDNIPGPSTPRVPSPPVYMPDLPPSWAVFYSGPNGLKRPLVNPHRENIEPSTCFVNNNEIHDQPTIEHNLPRTELANDTQQNQSLQEVPQSPVQATLSSARTPSGKSEISVSTSSSRRNFLRKSPRSPGSPTTSMKLKSAAVVGLATGIEALARARDFVLQPNPWTPADRGRAWDTEAAFRRDSRKRRREQRQARKTERMETAKRCERES